MTEASTGLRKALARAGGSVVAIAEMQTEDLLAEMTDEQKAQLADTLSPQISAAVSAADDSTAMKPKKDGAAEDDGDDDDAPMKYREQQASDAQRQSAADPRVKAVAEAVATDDACKGKADLALQMLADDDYAGLSASGIVKLLGKTNVSSATAADPEAAAREEMKAALAASANSNVAPVSESTPDKAQAASAPWNKVIAGMNPQKAV